MNLWLLVWSYLRSRPLNTALNILLLGLGIAVVTLVIVVNHQLQQKVISNSRGIDMVVGAKGSPMQLILCNIFHVDFPTGNIRLREAERIARHRLVRRAIPLTLGDSYQGYRIVGTIPAYAELYHGKVRQGQLWEAPMEVVLGDAVARALQLDVGSRFLSSHGLSASGHAHEEHGFLVSGILERTNSVLDDLIITSVESIWLVHDVRGVGGARPLVASPLIPSVAAGDSIKEITALLIQYRSAMGAVQLPRWVNSQSNLQAASPAFETARLFSIVGIGVDILKAFASVLIFISALSIFIALYNSLKERKYDLAIMRSMGASRGRILLAVLLEGMILALTGACFGILLAHIILIVSPSVLGDANTSGITGLIFLPQEGIILVAGLLLGIVCALLPALQAYKTDISRVLASAQ